jgi:hypothetical protein
VGPLLVVLPSVDYASGLADYIISALPPNFCFFFSFFSSPWHSVLPSHANFTSLHHDLHCYISFCQDWSDQPVQAPCQESTRCRTSFQARQRPCSQPNASTPEGKSSNVTTLPSVFILFTPNNVNYCGNRTPQLFDARLPPHQLLLSVRSLP